MIPLRYRHNDRDSALWQAGAQIYEVGQVPLADLAQISWHRGPQNHGGGCIYNKDSSYLRV